MHCDFLGTQCFEAHVCTQANGFTTYNSKSWVPPDTLTVHPKSPTIMLCLFAGYVKYGYPIAAATTLLAWGLIEFPTVSFQDNHSQTAALCQFYVVEH